MNYAVIFRYSFDDDTAVYLFATEEEAKNFLRDNYEFEVKINEDIGYSFDAEISDDGWGATITEYFQDHNNITEMFIGNIYE